MSDAVTTFAGLTELGYLDFSDGYRTKKAEHGTPGVPILRVADVLDGRIEPATTDHVSNEYRAAMGAKISRPGDVIVTTKGTVGRVAIMPDEAQEFVYSPQICYFRLKSGGPLIPKYLYYWFKSDYFWAQAKSRKSQTDMADYINLADINSLMINIPTRPHQQAIAGILGVLDDKIAANDRIAATTIALADAHFEAEATDLKTSDVDTFGTVAAVFGGGTPRTSEPGFWDGNIAWTTPTDVTALRASYLFGTVRQITELGLRECASQIYPAGSIFMTSRATIGSFAIPQIPAAVNQGFIVVVPPHEQLRWWLFHEMRSRVEEMIGLANGSTFLELSRKNFKAMHVRLANQDRLMQFARQVDPLHRRAAKTVGESRTLAKLRDSLLPGLMSGEIRVREAEKVVEEAT